MATITLTIPREVSPGVPMGPALTRYLEAVTNGTTGGIGTLLSGAQEAADAAAEAAAVAQSTATSAETVASATQTEVVSARDSEPTLLEKIQATESAIPTDTDTPVFAGVSVGGVVVLSAQGAAVADVPAITASAPSITTVSGSGADTAINDNFTAIGAVLTAIITDLGLNKTTTDSIIARLEAHGLIAS